MKGVSLVSMLKSHGSGSVELEMLGSGGSTDVAFTVLLNGVALDVLQGK